MTDFTVEEYLKHINRTADKATAVRIGVQAKDLSKVLDLPVGRVPHKRYGHVNSYKGNVLAGVIAKEVTNSDTHTDATTISAHAPGADVPEPNIGVIVMSALTTTTAPTPFDGFALDDGEPSGGSEYGKFDAAQGTRPWHGRIAGTGLYLGPYWAVNVFPENLKWGDKKVVGRILPEPGKPLPDVDEENAKIPEKDWEEDFNGKPKGPWARNYTAHFVDPKTGAKVIVSNSTVGQRVACQELKERTQFMRKLRG